MAEAQTTQEATSVEEKEKAPFEKQHKLEVVEEAVEGYQATLEEEKPEARPFFLKLIAIFVMEIVLLASPFCLAIVGWAAYEFNDALWYIIGHEQHRVSQPLPPAFTKIEKVEIIE